MTPRECVRRTIVHEAAPYVPLGFYTADHDTVEAVIGHETYVRNKIKCQIGFWEGRRDEIVASLKEDSVAFFRKIDCCDLITFKEAPIVPPKGYVPPKFKRLDDVTWKLDDGSIWRVAELTNDITCVQPPDAVCKKQPSMNDYVLPPQVAQPDDSIYEAFDYLVAKLGEERYIAGFTGGFTAMVDLPGENGGLVGYYLMPEVVRAAARYAVERERQLDAWHLRPGIAGVLFEQDMASSKGPMISPELFREFCLPSMKARVNEMKQRGYQVLFHNCGNNRPLMDQFIEAGIDCYQSLQTIPEMELGGLKRDFGRQLTFWGGVPLEILLTGSPEDCRKCVRDALTLGAPGGGFILGPSHSIAKGTRYANFMAMLDEHMRLRDKVG